MIAELVRGLSTAIPDTEWRAIGTDIQGVVRDVDGWFSVRLHAFPFAEIFVQTRKLDGFELALSYKDRARTGEHPFERMFDVRTNDDVLAAHWLDDEARTTLAASRYPYHVSDFAAALTEAKIANMVVYRTWKYELAGDRIVATKGTAETEPARIARAVTTACALAGRSQRWATPYRELARAIGASARGEVELGLTSQPVISAERHGLDVELRLVREVAGTERLRTVIGTRRVGVAGGAWSYVNDDLPRRSRPPLPGKRRDRDDIGGSGGNPRNAIEEPARKLFELARPDAAVVDTGRVELWFDGAPTERTRIDAAIELCARWAVDVPANSGPYR